MNPHECKLLYLFGWFPCNGRSKGICISSIYEACLVGFTFPSIPGVVAESNKSNSRRSDAVRQLPRWDRNGFLPLIFLNWRDPKEDHKEDEKSAIEEEVNWYCFDQSHGCIVWGGPLANHYCGTINLGPIPLYIVMYGLTKWLLNKWGFQKLLDRDNGKLLLVLQNVTRETNVAAYRHLHTLSNCWPH